MQVFSSLQAAFWRPIIDGKIDETLKDTRCLKAKFSGQAKIPNLVPFPLSTVTYLFQSWPPEGFWHQTKSNAWPGSQNQVSARGCVVKIGPTEAALHIG